MAVRIRSWIVSMVLAVFVASATTGAGAEKKLIQYGWDVQQRAYIAEHIREMEKRPLDGVIMRTDRTSFSHVFWNKTLNEAETAANLKAMANIKWKKFTDNFLMIYCRSNMDWFSEEDWAPDGWVLRNVRLCAKAARVGRCVGVCFDPESFWGPRPWYYAKQLHAEEKSFAEYEAIVRKRGAQFMEALQAEYPDLVVHTLYLVAQHCYNEAMKEPDPAKRGEILQTSRWPDEALWPAFVNGMVEGAKGKTIISDGNEQSYYYHETKNYFDSVQVMREGVKLLFDPAIWPNYQKHVRAGQAIYVDYVCNLLPMRQTCSNLTPKERAKRIEHNLYYALTTSDRYVWIYSEYMDWWRDMRVPPYLEDAIRSAKRKVAQSEPLGFDIEPMVNRSNKQLWADRAEFDPETSRIQRLTAPPPTIDGKLDDAAWKEPKSLGPFVAYVEAPEYNLPTKTAAHVTYDNDNLYVAFHCAEPDMKATRAGQGGAFDDVTVMLAPEKDRSAWRVFGVGADGKRKDAHPDGEKADWKPDYESAVQLREHGWSVEMAIPWKSLDRSVPKAGEKLAANVAHMRYRWREEQYSTWSRFRGKLDRKPSWIRVEPDLLGLWVFE